MVEVRSKVQPAYLVQKTLPLKVLVAACLTDEEVIIHNVPLISDFKIMVDIIKELGGDDKLIDHTCVVRIKWNSRRRKFL